MDESTLNLFEVAEITIEFEVPTENGPAHGGFKIPLKYFYDMYKAIHDDGVKIDTIKRIALFGVGIAKEGKISANDVTHVHIFIEQLRDKNFFSDEIWHTAEDSVLSLSYRLLSERKINYQQAAAGASYILERPINTAAWKQRVIRWAEKQGKPKVGQRIRHPKGTKQGGKLLSHKS